MRIFLILLAIISIFVLVVAFLVHSQSRVGKNRLLTNFGISETGAGAETLVVLLHSFTASGSSMGDVATAMLKHYGADYVDILAPDLPLGTFSTASTETVIAELVAAVDKAWDRKADSGSPYSRVILVGHSFGALLARKLYVVGNGESAGAPFEQRIHEELERLQVPGAERRRPWAEKMERIVLLAGMNRGWSISHHMSFTRAAGLQAGVGLAYGIEFFTGRLPIIMTIRRGAPFITQLRLQWLEMERQLNYAESDPAIVIQLLGTVDDLVSPDDNIDLVTGRNFIYREVPKSGHKSVAEFTTPDNPGIGQARKQAFLQSLAMHETGKSMLAEEQGSQHVDESVTDVLFVIHGIRDLGHWTRKIARRVKLMAAESGASSRKFATETSSYGYFPMLSFLIPGARQEKVEWLMDRYTEARARYPNARRFHYVGHSHGTYLLVKALEDYPSVSFENVVFAGSVVQHRFDWSGFVPSRVKNVRNYVATADWVVAYFPKSFELMNVQDLGSAGHDGFEFADKLEQVSEPEQFVAGAHSAALQEDMWDNIARFILTGEPQAPNQALMQEKQAWWVAVPSRIAPVLLLLLVVVLGLIFFSLINSDITEPGKTLLVLGYLLAVWTVVTKV